MTGSPALAIGNDSEQFEFIVLATKKQFEIGSGDGERGFGWAEGC
jgi:hypothetical protein